MEFKSEDGLREIQSQKDYWKAFVEKEGFEFGIMNLKPGEEDNQQPHKSDEVYFILSGNGTLTIEDQHFQIQKGKIFYVKKGSKHRFSNYTEPIVAYYALN